ncbi:MAG: hypothetical protein EZS28_005156 [Streblomastix strix]|uniref:Uncharacterized protein n=1 Tax=Streblomastix strix TaxID=222440 RepID=A0A5J4WWB7_9EUKA|nr:MAG: hypothetical protein EZS28_005156 [Streblomastix strix]
MQTKRKQLIALVEPQGDQNQQMSISKAINEFSIVPRLPNYPLLSSFTHNSPSKANHALYIEEIPPAKERPRFSEFS